MDEGDRNFQDKLFARAGQEQKADMTFNIPIDASKSESENAELALYHLTETVGREFETFLLVSTLSYIRTMEERFEKMYKGPIPSKMRDILAIAFREGQMAGMVSVLFKSYKGLVVFHKITEKGESTN